MYMLDFSVAVKTFFFSMFFLDGGGFMKQPCGGFSIVLGVVRVGVLPRHPCQGWKRRGGEESYVPVLSHILHLLIRAMPV